MVSCSTSVALPVDDILLVATCLYWAWPIFLMEYFVAASYSASLRFRNGSPALSPTNEGADPYSSPLQISSLSFYTEVAIQVEEEREKENRLLRKRKQPEPLVDDVPSFPWYPVYLEHIGPICNILFSIQSSSPKRRRLGDTVGRLPPSYGWDTEGGEESDKEESETGENHRRQAEEATQIEILKTSLAGDIYTVSEEEEGKGEATGPPSTVYYTENTPDSESHDTTIVSGSESEGSSDSESTSNTGSTENIAQVAGSGEGDVLPTPEQPNGLITYHESQQSQHSYANSGESATTSSSEDPDSEAEVATSGTSGNDTPHSWFTLVEVANTSRESVIGLEHRIPASEKYEIRRTRTGIRLAEQEGLKLPNLDDAALAKQGVFICKLTWEVVVDAQGALRWHRLDHGPCNQTYTGRHNWIRHFKDGHVGKTRPRK
ncbi:hypothetical protein CPB86DRAFT_800449 [Serendipita vermifera]|nr:hypothetical protein CPB86DRAFT_800449 [Serendipita vermifera]